MSDFVERCRDEWTRLGVPDPLAEEMAADLATDLREAEAEGVSAEELLGSSVFDPRAFAASWAAERGVIPESAGGASRTRRPLLLVLFTAAAAITLVLAALLLVTGEPKVGLVASGTPRHLPSPPAGTALPPARGGHVVSASASAPVEWILLVVAIVALGFAARLWASWGRSRAPTAIA